MRIVGGKASGIRLRAPSGRAVRPTSDRVKESLFSSLGDIRGWRVLDLFAGTGSLGLEALSRGAASVTFVERDAETVRFIRNNLRQVERAFGNQPATPTRILRLDVRTLPGALPDMSGKFDLILADPPYRPRADNLGAEKLLMDTRLSDWADRALMVLEHPSDLSLPWSPQSPWHLIRQREFGSRKISFCSTGQSANNK